MKLDDLQELVDFMKENGVAELDYAEKNNSVHLRLAPPAPPVPPCPEGAGGPNVTAEDVKNAATKAAAAFSDSVKASAAAAAEFIKTKRDERAAGEEPVDAEVEEPAEEPEDEAEEAAAPAEETAEAETEDEDAEEEAEEAPAEEEPEDEDEEEEEADDEEKVKLNTGAVRSAAKKAGEAVANTAKAGVSLGKLGLTKGRDALSALFPQKDEPEAEAEEPVSEEPAAEEAPADEEETKTEE